MSIDLSALQQGQGPHLFYLCIEVPNTEQASHVLETITLPLRQNLEFSEVKVTWCVQLYTTPWTVAN